MFAQIYTLQAKELITRETIKKELLFECQAQIRSGLPLIPLWLLLAFTVGGVALLSPPEQLFLTIIIHALVHLPLFLFLGLVFDSLAKQKRIKQGGFTVTPCELSYKSEEYRRGYRGKPDYTECFHFKGFRRVEDVPHTTYQLADAGETFYLVTYSGSTRVQLFYAAERYEFRELFDNTPAD